MKIALLGSLGADEVRTWTEALAQALEAEGLRNVAWWWPRSVDEIGAGVDVVLAANPPAGELRRVPQVRFIQSLWAGVDRLMQDHDLAALQNAGQVVVARMVDPAMSAAMAETAHWAVLSLHRRFFDYSDLQRQARWQTLAQRRADEVPVLVLGAGAMGGVAAERLAAAGYPVTMWARQVRTFIDPPPRSSESPCRSPKELPLLVGREALHEALSNAEIVVNLLPLTPETRGMLNAGFWSRCRDPALGGVNLVNLARGAHVADADLLQALDSGRVQRAVLDVFASEPLAPEHPYWCHPRVTVLPHAAAHTDPRSASRVVAANVARWQRGEAPLHKVERARGY